jgi:hypothetical protein
VVRSDGGGEDAGRSRGGSHASYRRGARGAGSVLRSRARGEPDRRPPNCPRPPSRGPRWARTRSAAPAEDGGWGRWCGGSRRCSGREWRRWERRCSCGSHQWAVADRSHPQDPHLNVALDRVGRRVVEAFVDARDRVPEMSQGSPGCGCHTSAAERDEYSRGGATRGRRAEAFCAWAPLAAAHI